MKAFTKHLIGGLLAIALAVVFYIKSIALPEVGAKLPRLLIVLIILLSLGMMLEAYMKDKKRKKEETEETTQKKNNQQVIIFTLLIALYIFTIKPLGYFVVTPIYIIGTYVYLKSTNIKNAAIISVCFTIFVYLLFVKFLKLPIPLGPMA